MQTQPISADAVAADTDEEALRLLLGAVAEAMA